MHSLWIKGLFALVSLALASWTVHAMAYVGVTPTEHCRGIDGRDRPAGHHDHGQVPDTKTCCCDFVACAATAIVAPASSVGTAELAIVSYRPAADIILSDGTGLLEPDPPRLSALN